MFKASTSFVAALTAALLLFPIRISSLYIGQSLVYFFVVMISGAYLLSWTSTLRINSHGALILAFGALFSLLFVLSLLINLPVNFMIVDMVEPLKPFFSAIMVLSGMKLATNVSQHKVVAYVIIVSFLSILFSAFVYWEPLYPVVDLYKGRPSFASWNYHFTRFSGTVGYPSTFGVWLVLVSLVILQAHLSMLLRLRFAAFLYLLVCSAVVLTGSRMSIVLYLLCTSLFLSARINSVRLWMLFVVVAVLMVTGAWLLLPSIQDASAVDYIKRGVVLGGGDGSVAQRINELSMLGSSLSEGNLIGKGPDNYYLDEHHGPIESAYFFYGYKFGLFGLGYYIALIALCLYSLVIAYTRDRHSFAVPLFIWSIVTLAVGGLSISVLDEYKSFFMFYILLGVGLRYVFETSLNRRSSSIPLSSLSVPK